MTDKLKTILSYLENHQVQARILLIFVGICFSILTLSFSTALVIQAYHSCFTGIIKAATSMMGM